MSWLNTFPRWLLYWSLRLIGIAIVVFFVYGMINKFQGALPILSIPVFILGNTGVIFFSTSIHDQKIGYVRALTPEEIEEKEKKKRLKATKRERNLKWKQLMEAPTSQWDDKRRCPDCGNVMGVEICSSVWDNPYGCKKSDRRKIAKKVASSMVMAAYTYEEDSREKRIQNLEYEINQYDSIINESN